MDGEINKLLRRMNMGVRSPAGFSIATLIPIGVRLFSLIQMGRCKIQPMILIVSGCRTPQYGVLLESSKVVRVVITIFAQLRLRLPPE